jgi:hypothetical protein
LPRDDERAANVCAKRRDASGSRCAGMAVYGRAGVRPILTGRAAVGPARAELGVDRAALGRPDRGGAVARRRGGRRRVRRARELAERRTERALRAQSARGRCRWRTAELPAASSGAPRTVLAGRLRRAQSRDVPAARHGAPHRAGADHRAGRRRDRRRQGPRRRADPPLEPRARAGRSSTSTVRRSRTL